jgi:hypothetical protein
MTISKTALKWAGYSLLKISVFAFGLKIGVDNSAQIKKAWSNIVDGNQPIAEQFHKDPYQLRIEHKTNTAGELETYLTYKQKTHIPVHKDLLPNNEYIIQALNTRLENSAYKSLKKALPYITSLYNNVNKKLGIKVMTEENCQPCLDLFINKILEQYKGDKNGR